jgi:hypothetical protein
MEPLMRCGEGVSGEGVMARSCWGKHEPVGPAGPVGSPQCSTTRQRSRFPAAEVIFHLINSNSLPASTAWWLGHHRHPCSARRLASFSAPASVAGRLHDGQKRRALRNSGGGTAALACIDAFAQNGRDGALVGELMHKDCAALSTCRVPVRVLERPFAV